MSQIHSKDTSVEIKVRKYLFSKGFRYRKNDVRLPGKPDIVLPKYRTVIFINGCFWHRHENCPRATTPKSRTDYWENKFARNVFNDRKHIEDLANAGWHSIIIWECRITHDFDATMSQVVEEIIRNSKD